MGKGIESRTTRKLLLGSASALALGIAFVQGATAGACGSGSDTTIAAACTGPFNWTGGNLTIAGAGTITAASTAGIGILGGNTVGTLTNSGSISITTGAAAALHNLGTLASIANSGGISGHIVGIDNGGSIGTITNAGTIQGHLQNTATIGALYNNLGAATDDIYNTGQITLLSNEGLIDKGGLYSEGTIATLINNGTIRSNSATAAITNGGVIGTLTNNGLITGPMAAMANYNGTIELVNNGQMTGQIGLWNTGSILLTNAGTLAGDINNTGTLTISGGSNGTIGTLTGYNGSIGTFTGSALTFDTGELVLNDVIANGVIVVGTGGTLTNAGSIGTIGGVSVGSLASLESFTNSGEIAGGSAFSNAGSIGALTNHGTILGSAYGIYNLGEITSIANGGSINAGAFGIANDSSGHIGTIDNSGWLHGLQNFGTVDLLHNANGATIAFQIYNTGEITELNNEGIMAPGSSVTTIRNLGQIGTLTNTGLISTWSEGYVLANMPTGTVEVVNLGTIAGNIINYGGLTISGGTGGTVGTLTGGSITGEVVFASGTLLLDDDGDGGRLINSGVTLQVNRTLTLGDGNGTIGSFSQSSGTLQFGPSGGLVVSGSVNFTGGSIVVGDATGTYSFGQTRTVIAADDSSSYTGATIKTGFLGLYFTKATTGGDLVLTYTNDYIGGTLASFAESRSISGGQYAIYIGTAGNIGTLTNSGTLVGLSNALSNTGIIGELDNLAGATIGDSINATGVYNSSRIDTLVNAGTIRGNIAGLRNIGGTIGLIRNEGVLQSDTAAVFNTGSIGTIASTITNTSMIQGSIDNRGIIDLIDNSAGITGNGVAIYSAGTIGTIRNTGMIRNSYSGAGITLAGGTIGVLDNSGVIGDRGALAVTGGRLGELDNRGTMSGITLTGGTIGTLSNAKEINGYPIGIDNSAGSIENLINAVGGTIFGNSTAIKNSGGIGTLSNSGLITGTNYALNNESGGTISIVNSGTIAGNIDNTGTLTISGGSGGTVGTLTGLNGSIGAFAGSALIFDTGALVLNDVISEGVTVVGTGGSLTNTGSIGTISGVWVDSLASLVSFTNSGSLAASSGIVNAGITNKIINTETGTIESTGSGYFAGGILNYTGSIGSIENRGLIFAGAGGVAVINAATISVLTNWGTIESQGGSAAIINGAGGMGILENRGTITGGGSITGGTSSYAAILNTDTITALTNSGKIEGLGVGAAINNTGSIIALTNTGAITGRNAIENEAEIGSISNSGTITGTGPFGVSNTGTIHVLSNSGLLEGGNGVWNWGQLDTLVNTGTIRGASSVGVGNSPGGTIGTLSNSGLITGSVEAIGNVGTMSIINSGTIAGNIVNNGHLTISGGSGTVVGTLSGGTISGNVLLNGGNLLLADDVYGTLAIEGGIVQIASPVSITGSLTQGGGVLDMLSGGELIVAGDAHLSSGLIVVEGLSSGGNYSAGDQLTLIAADDTSDYSGVSIQLSVPGVSATTTIANGDLIAIFGNDYIGGTLASTTLTGSMGGGDYGYFIGGTGSIGSLTNNGTLNGNEYAFYNGGTIGTFENNGQIVDGTGLANAGSIGVLTNNAVISGGNGLANFGTIDTLTNAASGVITGTTNAGIYNTGSIGQLTNSGTITGPVYAIDNSGSLGPITNSGTIAGNIRSTSTLSIAGGTGATYGVLSGGTITADVNFTAGNLRLSDAVVGQVSNSGAQLQLGSTLTITGAYSQTAGTLDLGSNVLTVSGTASISGGTVSADLPAAANYLVGQSIMLIDAAAGSSYAGATVNLNAITGLSAAATTASTEDLAITFGNDYIGASLASLNNTGAISGAAYGVYVASSGTLGALANAGTVRGTQYAIYSAGILGTITNTGLISGNIRSSGALAFAGTGGTLSGGTITATGVSIAGSLRLADAINVGSGTVNAGTASVELPSKITITGNYLQTGGVLSSDITDTTTYGALAVSGSATITNTTITVNGTSVRSGRTYTIVDAGAASSYTGDAINLVGAHYRAELSTVGDDLIASFKPLFGEIGAAKGGASAVMGGVLDQLSNNTALQPMIDRMSLLSDVDLGRALEQAAPADVGGGGASLQRTSLIEDLIGRAVSSRRSAAAGWSVWQAVLGGSAQRSAVAGAAGYDTTAAGLVLGVDSRIREALLIGAALSWSAGWNAGRGDVSGSANGVNGFALTGYGSWTDGALTVNGRVAVGLDHYKQHRTLTALNEKAEADYSGQHYVIGADGSYDFTLAPGVTLSPQASLRWLRLAADGYSESGVGALTVGSVIADQVQSSLGAKLAWTIDTRFGPVMPEIRAAWLHDFVDDPGEANAGLGGLSFTTTSARISANGIRVGTGLTFYQSDATSLRLEYDGDFRDDYTAHGGMLQLSLKL